MKKFKNMLASLTTGVMIAGLVLSFSACTERSPLDPGDKGGAVVLNKGNVKEKSLSSYLAATYPYYGEETFHLIPARNTYRAGTIQLDDGSSFNLDRGALTPPSGTPQGVDVTVTMLVEKDTVKNELIFTFGPHGCEFNPPAEVWFDWDGLDSPDAILYYIDEDGNYIEQVADDIDRQGHRLKLYIKHFSRYAIGWGE